jgi:hypothetical protein
MGLLRCDSASVCGKLHDPLIAAWLLDPRDAETLISLDKLLEQYCTSLVIGEPANTKERVCKQVQL